MPKVAIVAALEREVAGLTKKLKRMARKHEDREFIFFECDELVVVCAGIGSEAARRAAEAVIAVYRPVRMLSVGFAGALQAGLRVAEVFSPAVFIDARDGSRTQCQRGDGILVSYMAVASREQKAKLAEAYGAQLVDMEAAAVAAAAHAHGIEFGAVKVVSDEWDLEMPGMDRFINAGQFHAGKFAMFVALRPWLWWRVAVLAKNSKKAAGALVAGLEQLRRELIQSRQPYTYSNIAGHESHLKES